MILAEIGHEHTKPITIWCNNSTTIALYNNITLHIKLMHFAINFHFVCEIVVVKTLQVPFVSSEGQLLDLLTKASFQVLQSKLTFEVLLGSGGHIKDRIN